MKLMVNIIGFKRSLSEIGRRDNANIHAYTNQAYASLKDPGLDKATDRPCGNGDVSDPDSYKVLEPNEVSVDEIRIQDPLTVSGRTDQAHEPKYLTESTRETKENIKRKKGYSVSEENSKRRRTHWIKFALLGVFVILLVAVICLILFYLLDVLGIRKSFTPSTTVPVPTTATPVEGRKLFQGKVILLEEWLPQLADSNSSTYKTWSDDFTSQINSIFRNSSLKDVYNHSSILSFSNGSIHIVFRLLFNTRLDWATKLPMVTVSLVLDVMVEGIKDRQSNGLFKWKIDLDIQLQEILGETTSRVTTLNVKSTSKHTSTPLTITQTENQFSSPSKTSHIIPTSKTITTTTATYTQKSIPRTTPKTVTCVRLDEVQCQTFGYNETGFPNIIGHTDELQTYKTAREFFWVASQNCFKYALWFGCTTVYPPCVGGRLISPCREFCEEFRVQCSYPIACNKFPDDDDPSTCLVVPTKESSTVVPPTAPPAKCSSNQFQCGDSSCVAKSSVCNRKNECVDGTDELHCGQRSKWDCNFEKGECNWRQDVGDHFDWILHSGSTPSRLTGPQTDHTFLNQSGHYMLAEASGRYWADQARLVSTDIINRKERCLRFYYHMYGSSVGTLKVIQWNLSGEKVTLWTRRHNQGNQWKMGLVTLPSGIFKVVFEALRGNGYKGDIALDDLTIRDGPCPMSGCLPSEFQCHNQQCLLKEYVCNGHNDCGDFTDEMNCSCKSHQYKCGMGLCIPSYQRCDQKTQCPDGSDEKNCVCPHDQYRCPDGKCIMSEWICDRERDCSDGSDENNCSVCHTHQFTCQDFSCVSTSALCDGIKQCPDGSDEYNCVKQGRNHKIEVYHQGSWLPLCSKKLHKEWPSALCKEVGLGAVKVVSSQVTSGGQYFTASNAAPDFVNHTLKSYLTLSSTCEGNTVLVVECREADCGKPSPNVASGFVVNGRDAPVGKWPWHVGVYFQGELLCGGTLVTRYHVITASHCVGSYANRPDMFRVSAGSNRRTGHDSHRVNLHVSKIQNHWGFKKYYWGYDIAIFTLRTPVTFNDYIKPVCLPTETNTIPQNSLCYSYGWGYSDFGSKHRPEILQEAKMQLWSNKKCKRGHSYVTDSMVCAGYDSGYVATCIGDSGGSLVCRDHHGQWQITGVFSFMMLGCNVPMKPPVFTRVQYFLSWIHSVIECKFKCGNKKCLYDEESLCNGVDDCGDNSDEIRTCKPTVTCSFEQPYICGYTYVRETTVNRWTPRISSYKVNEGPLSDHTFGNESGKFLYAGMNLAVLLSPVFERSISSCLRFYYHMRGREVGTLHVFSHVVEAHEISPEKVNISKRNILFTKFGNQGDKWHVTSIDIPKGRFVIGYEAIARASNTYPAIAIDDVQLLNGTCANQGCEAGMFRCIKGKQCLPPGSKCDFINQCSDHSDETGCTGAKYSCNFEVYGRCNLQQSHTDDLDWRIIPVSRALPNGPTSDHTKSAQQGFLAHMATSYGQPGAMAQISLETILHEHTCLTLYYNMISNGSLSVITYDKKGTAEVLWQISKVNTSDWKRVEIPVTSANMKIMIQGTVGPISRIVTKSYIAIDDVSMKQEKCSKPACKPSEFQCIDGKCIPSTSKCNGKFDCKNREDEKSCSCSASQLKCGNGLCISDTLACNGRDDCGDGTDEVNCMAGELAHRSTLGSESQTTRSACKPSEFQCKDGTCKTGVFWCDGYKDCADASDELPGCQCRDDQFRCANSLCIPGQFWCNNMANCHDKSDEPPNCSCESKWTFKCKNGKCVAKTDVCDTFNDCGDESDEMGCPCKAGQYQCKDGPCIHASRRCDGVPDCPKADDEPPNCDCGSEGFRCASGTCINKTNVCDRVPHCYDLSDEANCVCTKNELRCSSGICLNIIHVCNGIDNCGDGSDEKNCTCLSHEFQCASGMCIHKAYRCNGHDNCGDGSDEVGCSCKTGEHRCPDGKCIQKEWLCDGSWDCSDGTDEAGCSRCRSDQFVCKDYSCVGRTDRCDGYPDCTDGSDEHDCVKLNVSVSNTLQVQRPEGWYSVCADHWLKEWSATICKTLGQNQPIYSGASVVPNKLYLVVPKNFPVGTTYNHSLLQLSSTCLGSKVVRIACAHKDCGLRSPNITQVRPYVIGGDIAVQGTWPWMAAIFYLGAYRCGGTLVSRQWVVSAAHCFMYQGRNIASVTHYFSILLGATNIHDRSSRTQLVKVRKIIMHPGYKTTNSFRYDDIAMVQLDKQVSVSDLVRPTCLPGGSATLHLTSHCFVTGWGYTFVHRRVPAQDLREAKFRLWSDTRCNHQQAWNQKMNITTQLCAGYETGYVATCFGDSGGPLVCQDENRRWVLAGTVSQGSHNCGATQPGKPTIFSKTSAYVKWMEKMMKTYR